jgi:hypothetical protein
LDSRLAELNARVGLPRCQEALGRPLLRPSVIVPRGGPCFRPNLPRDLLGKDGSVLRTRDFLRQNNIPVPVQLVPTVVAVFQQVPAGVTVLAEGRLGVGDQLRTRQIGKIILAASHVERLMQIADKMHHHVQGDLR